MDFQLNFKTSHQLAQLVRHIHFTRKNLKDELCIYNRVSEKTFFQSLNSNISQSVRSVTLKI
jgi:hypothetical protein